MEEKYELFLWNTMEFNGQGKPFPRDVIEMMVKSNMIESAKQAWRTLEKWEKKGIYDYGITLDLGWKVNKEAFESKGWVYKGEPIKYTHTEFGCSEPVNFITSDGVVRMVPEKVYDAYLNDISSGSQEEIE